LEGSVEVRITEDIRLATDDRNWVIQRRHVPKTGKKAGEEQWRAVGYYGRLDQCCEELLCRHLQMLTTGADDVAGLLREVRRAKDAIRGAVAAIGGKR
jgi:hypothetical protein